VLLMHGFPYDVQAYADAVLALVGRAGSGR